MRSYVPLGLVGLLGCAPDSSSLSRASSPGALRSFSLSDYCLGPALTVSWEQGSQEPPLRLAVEQLDSVLHRAACCDLFEDAWLYVPPHLYDIGYFETPDSVAVDFLRLEQILGTAPPFVVAQMIHTHPLPTDEVYPPSPCDFVTGNKAARQIFFSPGVLVEHRMYDCYGVWQYHLSSSLADMLGLVTGDLDSNTLPALDHIDDLFAPAYARLFDTHLSREERVSWWLTQAPSQGFALSYDELRSFYGPFEE